MPTFVYRAKNGPVETVDGQLLAETESAALLKIENMGYSPVWIKEEEQAATSEGRTLSLRKIGQRDINIFTRQLAGLIKSGVPILRALRTVKEQSINRRFHTVVDDLESSVRDGKMLSDALSRHSNVFPELYVNMIRAGESAGVLDTILLRLAEAREKEEEIRKKVQSAMAYPMLVLVVGLLTIFVMVTFFLPKITDLFRNFSEVPLPTQILITVSDFCSDYWRIAIVAIVLLVAVVRRLTTGGNGRAVMDAFKLRLPVVGAFLKHADIARFARTFSLLVLHRP